MKQNPLTLSMNAHWREWLSCELVGGTIGATQNHTQIKHTTLTYSKTKVLVVAHVPTSRRVVIADGKAFANVTTSFGVNIFVVSGTTFLTKSFFPTSKKSEEVLPITEPQTLDITGDEDGWVNTKLNQHEKLVDIIYEALANGAAHFGCGNPTPSVSVFGKTGGGSGRALKFSRKKRMHQPPGYYSQVTDINHVHPRHIRPRVIAARKLGCTVSKKGLTRKTFVKA